MRKSSPKGQEDSGVQKIPFRIRKRSSFKRVKSSDLGLTGSKLPTSLAPDDAVQRKQSCESNPNDSEALLSKLASGERLPLPEELESLRQGASMDLEAEEMGQAQTSDNEAEENEGECLDEDLFRQVREKHLFRKGSDPLVKEIFDLYT
uniref:Uncharacterized protein n=1 Tax=Rhodosorus marinus TaxID=101924 RepID=A0A7S3EP14_9RHOD|mmetsp:Transcript_9601/g.41358  ORF Transcript_9601/g.41358 Transcript_9601/m.41358 type:complete len:149 (+) Transcript_9601:146-592(+)